MNDWPPAGSPSATTAASRVERSATEALEALDAAAVPRRIRQRDHTVWRREPDEISNRLGWLDVVGWMRPRRREVREFAARLAEEGVRDVLLLGMGGSSLAPEVFRRTFGSAAHHPRLHVLDTTSPAWIRRVTESIEPPRFHALVASKSGSTIEVLTLFAHFRELAQRTGEPGPHFTAITDPGTSLEDLARREGFRACFVNDPDIGGRYSALSYFGTVPAAVLGVDVGALLDGAEEMARACLGEGPAAENPGCRLGAWMGAAAGAGRDKLTLLVSPEIASFGLWVEQLVAESTGKDGTGIVPVLDEPVEDSARAGPDQVFVAVRLAEGTNEELDRRLAALAAAGQPVLRLDLAERISLGAEMYRWEYATAVAGHLLGVHPFDQPDVQSTKSSTQELLDTLTAGGSIPDEAPGDPAPWIEAAGPGEWVGILVFGDPSDELVEAVGDLRRTLRERCGLASTFGIGPRYLHSSGQLHKGGANRGLFVQILLEEESLPIPGRRFGFAELLAAQASGDLAALRAKGRRATRLSGESPAEALRALARRLAAS